MKLYFLPFFATVISVAESSLRANVFADEGDRDLAALDDRMAVLASDADETGGRRLCDKKCRRKKRRKRRNKDKGDDDDDDDDDNDGGSGGSRLQLYCGTWNLCAFLVHIDLYFAEKPVFDSFSNASACIAVAICCSVTMK